MEEQPDIVSPLQRSRIMVTGGVTAVANSMKTVKRSSHQTLATQVSSKFPRWNPGKWGGGCHDVAEGGGEGSSETLTWTMEMFGPSILWLEDDCEEK